jgi:hypothetical protein
MIATLVLVLTAATLPAAASVLVTVNASSGDQTATQQFLIQGSGGQAQWSLPTSVVLVANNGAQLGTLKNLDIQTDADPYVNLHFSVEAGASDTTFDVSSAVVSFVPMLNPVGYASAGVTLTSDDNGAPILGLFSGDTYEARYNSTTVYTDLIPSFAAPADQSVTNSDRNPISGNGPISGDVTSIQSEFDFTLSALEQASGTSRFELDANTTPEPATLSLLALGGLAMLRRKHRRRVS